MKLCQYYSQTFFLFFLSAYIMLPFQTGVCQHFSLGIDVFDNYQTR